MAIAICVAGATGKTGSAICRNLIRSDQFKLVGAVARKKSGQDIGEVLGLPHYGLPIQESLAASFAHTRPDVFIDFTHADQVQAHVHLAIEQGVHVVIGSSGLTAQDYEQIHQMALRAQVGVVAAGNFSLTAALLKHFCQQAAQFIPHREIIDFAKGEKADVPSGTARELAESLGAISPNRLITPIEAHLGPSEARGAQIAGTPVHSMRIPGTEIGVEVWFGLQKERITLRHEAAEGGEPYVQGTLLAASRAVHLKGLTRGLDQILFDSASS